MIRKNFALLCSILTMASCVQEKLNDNQISTDTQIETRNLVFDASFSQEDNVPQSKASLQKEESVTKVLWEEGDALTVLAVTGGQGTYDYRFTAKSAGETSLFECVEQVAVAPEYYTIYPYSTKHTISTDGVVSIYQPTSRVAAAGASIGFDAMAMGKLNTVTNTVSMKNVGGLISFNITQDNISKVIVYGNKGEKISGKVNVSLQEDGLPAVASVEGSHMVSLTPASDASVFEPGSYYVNVPPMTFEDGLTALFINSASKAAEWRWESPFEVKRSMVSYLYTNPAFEGKVVEFDNVIIDGNYTIPAEPGYVISKILVKTGTTTETKANPLILASNGAIVSGGNRWDYVNAEEGADHIWSIAADADESYSIRLASDGKCVLQKLTLIYAPAADAVTIGFNLFPGGKFEWPFFTPASSEIKSQSQGETVLNGPTNFVVNDGDNTYTYIIKAESAFRQGSEGYGLCLNGTATSGDYIEFPIIIGKFLTGVEISSGYIGDMRGAQITTSNGKVVSGGEKIHGDMSAVGQTHTWKLSGTKSGVRYRMSLTYPGTIYIRHIRLTFSDKPRQVPVKDALYYEPEEDGMIDFSRVGYRWGDKVIPSYPVLTTLTPPADGSDATALIQNAIDATNNGAVLLKEGTYRVSGEIKLHKSNVVLRGEGPDKTIVLATGTKSRDFIQLGYLGPFFAYDSGSASEIMTSRLAVGQMRVPVKEPWKFAVGDRVMIWRPATQKWIDDLGMNGTQSKYVVWEPSEMTITQERQVLAIEGDYIYLDNPVVMETSTIYGGGYLIKGHYDRISESGVEDLFIDTEFDASKKDYKGYYTDENHAKNAVRVRSAEHCWVRNVKSAHFIFATVYLSNGAKNITVENCHGCEPVSQITGSRRYAFQMQGAQLCLVKDCTAEKDRHSFATSHVTTVGPNVYLRCSATECIGDLGPHVKWSSGVLYDNVKLDKQYLAVQDRHDGGGDSNHGWAGVNFVLWNCEAPTNTSGGIICQNPWVTGKNYAVGCIGRKVAHNRTGAGIDRPEGEYYSHGTKVTSGTHFGFEITSESLYESQLAARHSAGIYIAK